MPHADDNPLLRTLDDPQALPAFDAIEAKHVEPAVDRVLAEAESTLAAVLASEAPPTWDGLAVPLEIMSERIDRVWSPVRHLHAVMDTPALRAAYDACLPKITAFYTALAHNVALYDAYRRLAASDGYRALAPPRQRVIDNALREFRLGGVSLEGAARERFAAIEERLAACGTRFANNVLDATQAWHLTLADDTRLAGLPPSAIGLARQHAEQAGETGYRFTLDLPCYLPVLSYADDRDLRAQMYEAFATRASDRGPDAGRFDNGALMSEILALRAEKAALLGLESYAHYSLERKMARSPDEVLEFLRDLARRTRPVAERELEEVRTFAHREHGQASLEAWDLAYYSEKLRQARFAISQEDLRPYFPAQRVIRGMFDVAERLFDIRFRAVEGPATWHRDVTFYVVEDGAGAAIGALYLDPYARTAKRGGAWMDVCRARCALDATLQTPVAHLTCNFTPPVGGHPALITHDEVTTLFHEFGHGLHHLLTEVDVPSVAGIAGVEWDAVELPSQFLENWCFEPQALALVSAHHETGEPLPEALLERLRAARNFQSGLQMLRQIEFALFDFRLHLEQGRAHDVLALLDEVRDEVAVLRPPPWNRFPHAFSHIFAGGYAAGYYSYKWAEVLASDAFARFEESGVFDPGTGGDFRREVLARGGTRDALESFTAFRGREPDLAALLRHSGIEPSPAGHAA
jgi:oligopeptidase A